MYNLKRNNYHQNPKNSTIYTPPAVSQFIFELLKDKFFVGNLVLDPCSGQGSLLEPWHRNKFLVTGVDNAEDTTAKFRVDFLELKRWKHLWPDLVLCNPPFNGYGNKLGSERSLSTFNKVGKVWLDKIIELFGKDTPIVLFAPVGFCANLTLNSKRLAKFEDGTYPSISSIITLPKNIFEGVIFHSEILIFNIKGLKGHYFLPKDLKIYE